ncbi:MAG: RluA family pseudouridine synthase [Burkholderiales bacterium]
MNDLGKESAQTQTIDDANADQRLDNYLVSLLKGVPKSHIHRIVRSGEVRINSRRAASSDRLRIGDRVRIPPIRIARPAARPKPGKPAQLPILIEDEFILVIDKPAGVAVHGGSEISFGVIEQLRIARPKVKFLELVHRLDRGTSGVLLLAKKRSALIALHEQLAQREMTKCYCVLVRGEWRKGKQEVLLPLRRFVSPAGERKVAVVAQGQESRTVFSLRKNLRGFSLLKAELRTGRTHQIRVQLAHLGFPVAGDDKYGDFGWNRELAKNGLKRMFLHAESVALRHPSSGEQMTIVSPLPRELESFLDRF